MLKMINMLSRISIHALREESDTVTAMDATMDGLFQSTLSVRRATGFRRCLGCAGGRSSPSPREESDEAGHGLSHNLDDFNPRSP